MKKKSILSISLPPEVFKRLSQEVRLRKTKDSSSNPSRTSIARALIITGLRRMPETPGGKKELNIQILRESIELKSKGKILLANNKKIEAQSMFLLAAAKELEALSILKTDSETKMRTTIIETLMLLKLATGYKNLPNIPWEGSQIQIEEN